MGEDTKGTEASQAKSSTLPSAFALFRPSIDALVLNIVTLLEILFTPLIAGFVTLIPIVIATGGKASSRNVWWLLAAISGLVTFGLAVIASGSLAYIQLCSANNKTIGYKEAFDVGRHVAWRMVGLGLCLVVIYTVSLLLLVVPFFFMLRRYYLVNYYLIDKDAGVFETLRLSAAQSKRFSGGIWGLIGVNFLLSLPEIIPIFGWAIGGLLQMLYFFAPAVRYAQIQLTDKRIKPHHSQART